MALLSDTQVSTSSIFYPQAVVHFGRGSNPVRGNGYTIYLNGSEATLTIALLFVPLADNRCKFQCYKANSTNQWVLIDTVDADTTLAQGTNFYNFAFNSNSTIANKKVFPEDVQVTFGSAFEPYIVSHIAGQFILQFNDGAVIKEYPIYVSQNENIINKITTTDLIATGDTEKSWVAEYVGGVLRFSSVTPQINNTTAFSINWGATPIVGAEAQSDYSFQSNGRWGDDVTRYYTDFDCARWKVVIEVPYGDQRIWAYLRANAFNTLNIINNGGSYPTYINDNYQYNYVYLWDKNMANIILSTIDNKLPNDIGRIVQNSNLLLSNYKSMTIRGRY